MIWLSIDDEDNNVPLEYRCQACNYWHRFTCDACKGDGYVLNENGERLLEFMRKYLLTDDRRNKL